MSACNDCWDEAFVRSRTVGGHQADHYEALIALPPSERPWCTFAATITTSATDADEEAGDE